MEKIKLDFLGKSGYMVNTYKTGVVFIEGCSKEYNKDVLVIFHLLLQIHFSSHLPCSILKTDLHRLYLLSKPYSFWLNLAKGRYQQKSGNWGRRGQVFIPQSPPGPLLAVAAFLYL